MIDADKFWIVGVLLCMSTTPDVFRFGVGIVLIAIHVFLVFKDKE